MRRIMVTLMCFRFIAVPSVTVTLAISFSLLSSGTPLFLVPAFWIKVITTPLLLLFVRLLHSSQFFFFNNIGCSTSAIYGNMVLVDVLMAIASFSFALLAQ